MGTVYVKVVLSLLWKEERKFIRGLNLG